MNMSPESAPGYSAASAERLVKGFNTLLSSAPEYRTSNTDQRGWPQQHVNIAEPDTIIPNGLVAWGVFLEASYGYDLDGTIMECSAYACDKNTGLVIDLPLDMSSGDINEESIAQWNETDRQRASVLLDRLLHVIFDANL